MRLKYSLGEEKHKSLDFDGYVFKQNEYTFELNAETLTVEGVALSDENKATVLKEVKAAVDNLADRLKGGKDIENFPVDVIAPVFGITMATQFCESLDFKDKFLDFEFSLDKLKLLSPKSLKLLKPIKGDFYNEVNEKGQQALFQILIDDNFFNSLTSIFTAIDKMFSLRDLTKSLPKA